MIPKKLEICGHTIEVKTVKRFICTRQNTYGKGEMAQDKIYLAKKDRFKNVLSGDWRMNTFLHEIIHHIDDKQETHLKEKQVNKLADGLYQTLKDNKLKFY